MNTYNRLKRYYEDGLSLTGALIVETVRKRPMYLVEIREALDIDAGTLNKHINRLVKKGWLVKEKVRAPSDRQGPPKSALVRLCAEALE